MGWIEHFGTDAVGGHLRDPLPLVLGAAGNVVGPLPAKIGSAVFKGLRHVLFPEARRLNDVGIRRDEDFINDSVGIFAVGSFNNAHGFGSFVVDVLTHMWAAEQEEERMDNNGEWIIGRIVG
jgi:hypothetical protein